MFLKNIVAFGAICLLFMQSPAWGSSDNAEISKDKSYSLRPVTPSGTQFELKLLKPNKKSSANEYVDLTPNFKKRFEETIDNYENNKKFERNLLLFCAAMVTFTVFQDHSYDVYKFIYYGSVTCLVLAPFILDLLKGSAANTFETLRDLPSQDLEMASQARYKLTPNSPDSKANILMLRPKDQSYNECHDVYRQYCNSLNKYIRDSQIYQVFEILSPVAAVCFEGASPLVRIGLLAFPPFTRMVNYYLSTVEWADFRMLKNIFTRKQDRDRLLFEKRLSPGVVYPLGVMLSIVTLYFLKKPYPKEKGHDFAGAAAI